MLKSDKSQGTRNGIEVGLTHQKGQKMIDLKTLKEYGGKVITIEKDGIIFRRTEESPNYFQVIGTSRKNWQQKQKGK